MQEEEEPTPQCRKRKHVKLAGHTRDRRGCLTCRQRKKKCDGTQGCCAQCQRLNLRCVWETVRDVAGRHQTAPTEYTAIVKAPSPAQFWAEASKDSRSSGDRRLAMRYYIQAFAGLMSTNTENNGFLSVLLPMAMDAPPLLDTIIAWSSSHLALWQKDLEVKALQDRTQALASLSASLTTADPTQNETFIAACLVHTSMDSIMGNTESWYDHLRAAASLIRATIAQDPDGNYSSSLEGFVEGRWLLRNFAYRDILASVSMSSPMLLPELAWFREEEIGLVDTYFGLASVPMAMLAGISTEREKLQASLTAATIFDELEDSECADSAERLSHIEQQLRAWSLHDVKDASLLSLAETYRSAALLHLYRTQRQYVLADIVNTESNIAREVEAVLHHAAQMPGACLPECTLLFPLFQAGGEARSEDQRLFVRARMQEMIKHRRFENVTTALDVLEEVWDVRSRTLPVDPSRPYDWTDVLERRRWRLALS